jgi:hypothetical protein
MGMALTEDGTLLVSADNLTLYAYRTQYAQLHSGRTPAGIVPL